MLHPPGYDPQRKVLVAYGGAGPDNDVHADVWELHQNQWKRIMDNGIWKWNGKALEKVQ
jgi:hypothetical protein